MPITTVDKVKINKYLKENNIDELRYLDMCDALGKRGKISDIEFLEYFTDSVINEFHKDSRISTKHLTKVIFTIQTFLGWIHDEEKEISDKTLDKIRNFEDFYNDYLSRNGLEIDESFNNGCIGVVLKTVNELFPAKIENETIIKYIENNSRLENAVEDLKKKLTNITKRYDVLQDSYNQKINRIDSLSKQIKDLEKEVINKEQSLTNLNKVIETLNIQITELETSLAEIQDQNKELLPYKEQCESLTTEVNKLNNIVAEDIRLKTETENLKARQLDIETLIYQKLLQERSSLDDILKYIKEKGFASNKDEILMLLRNLKSKINIDSNIFSLNPSYKVAAPNVLEDGQFIINIPNKCKHYDVMLVSDFHIRNFDSKQLSRFDLLNEYCSLNGINLILNLGDFYNGTFGASEYDNAVKNYQIIEKSISMIPKVDGLYHAILGGNHEKNMTKYGFDPIKMLSDERNDILNLGYTHSTISLNKGNNVLTKFDIHHPETFDFQVKLNDDGIDINGIEEFINNIYKKQARNRDDSYIDIFGHTHRNQFNHIGSYCYIPAYCEGNFYRGACHLRVYFDEETNVKYMVFMPLSLTDKLVKNNEIIYKKTLDRK